MKIKIDFDPSSKPSTLITLGIHHSRSEPLKFGFLDAVVDELQLRYFLFRDIPSDVIFFTAQGYHVSKTLITFSRGEEWIMMFAKA